MAVDETGHQRGLHRAGTVRIGRAIEGTLCGGEQETLGRLTLHLYGIRDLGSRDNREPPASDSKRDTGLHQKARVQSMGYLSK